MTHRSLAVLVVLNVALLAALSLTVLSPQPAQAQFGAGGRQYTMISGEVQGRSGQAAIYIIDINSGRIAPVFYNGSNQRFEFFAGRVVADDVRNATTNTGR